jgi:hypothetical protein
VIRDVDRSRAVDKWVVIIQLATSALAISAALVNLTAVLRGKRREREHEK